MKFGKYMLYTLFCILFILPTIGAIPTNETSQVILRSSSTKELLEGYYTFNYSLLNNAGGVLWTENQTVYLDNGIANILLGDSAPITWEMYYNTNPSMEIKVSNGAAMSYYVTSVPYSFVSDFAHRTNWTGITEKPADLDTNTLDDYTEANASGIRASIINNATFINNSMRQYVDSRFVNKSGDTMTGNLSIDISNTNAHILVESGDNMDSCVWLHEGFGYGFDICNDGSGVNMLRISDHNGNDWLTINRDDGVINFYNNTVYHEGLTISYLNATDTIRALALNTSYIYNPFMSGAMDIRADPWSLMGTDLNIQQDLDVDGNITASSIFADLYGTWNESSLYVPYTGATSDVNIGRHNYITNGSVQWTEQTGIQNLFYINPLNGDGFRMEYWYDFELANDDWLVFKKTDGNDNIPDGGIAFMMSNASNHNRTILKLDGSGLANFTDMNIKTSGNITANTFNGGWSGSILYATTDSVLNNISGLDDGNCSASNSCNNIVYSNNVTNYDKNVGDDYDDRNTTSVRNSIILNLTNHETNYKHGNDTTEIRSQFTSSSNISFDTTTGSFFINISVGGSSIADGNCSVDNSCDLILYESELTSVSDLNTLISASIYDVGDYQDGGLCGYDDFLGQLICVYNETDITGYYNDITNFTTTLADGKYCTYDGDGVKIECNSVPSGAEPGSKLNLSELNVTGSIIFSSYPDWNNVYNDGNASVKYATIDSLLKNITGAMSSAWNLNNDSLVSASINSLNANASNLIATWWAKANDTTNWLELQNTNGYDHENFTASASQLQVILAGNTTWFNKLWTDIYGVNGYDAENQTGSATVSSLDANVSVLQGNISAINNNRYNRINWSSDYGLSGYVRGNWSSDYGLSGYKLFNLTVDISKTSLINATNTSWVSATIQNGSILRNNTDASFNRVFAASNYANMTASGIGTKGNITVGGGLIYHNGTHIIIT